VIELLGREQIRNVFDQDVYGSDGAKIGTARQVYADDQTGQPQWVTVRTGLFGTKETFIPLADADVSGGRVTVPYTKDFVKGAPNLDDDGHLSPEEEQQLFAYYGRTDDDPDDHVGDARGRDQYGVYDDAAGRGVGHDTSGPTTDSAMTVSEERLVVGTQRREAGRARLRKYVVTENVTETVPVRREEVRLEREPITEANREAALSGPELSEAEHEILLHEERPVVQKETVPVERVRLDTEIVTEQRTVGGEVRKERVEVESDVSGVDRPVTDR
jgi:uncharacterized protein (TIGR02271 family)